MIGIPNRVNTCYINSILQVLRVTPFLREVLRKSSKEQNSLSYLLSEMFDYMYINCTEYPKFKMENEYLDKLLKKINEIGNVNKNKNLFYIFEIII